MNGDRSSGLGATNLWKWALGATTLLIVTFTLASQTALFPSFFRIPGPPAVQPDARDARWRQDVQYLGAQLPRLHVDAFHTLRRQEFAWAIANLDAAIPFLTDLEIALEIERIVAMVGDAHTQAIPPSSLDYHLYPLKLYWFKDAFYVIAADYRKD